MEPTPFLLDDAAGGFDFCGVVLGLLVEGALDVAVVFVVLDLPAGDGRLLLVADEDGPAELAVGLEVVTLVLSIGRLIAAAPPAPLPVGVGLLRPIDVLPAPAAGLGVVLVVVFFDPAVGLVTNGGLFLENWL